MDSPFDRARAWLVTGPLGRGLAFAVDFGAALLALARRWRASRAIGRGASRG
jgi:hypothetical protein